MLKLKRTLVVSLILMLLIQAASAEVVLSIYLVVSKNDSVTVKEFKVKDGKRSFYIPPGSYRLDVTDSAGAIVESVPFRLDYVLWSEPPTRIDSSPIELRVKYASDMRFVKLYKEEKMIFSRQLSLCNRNGICDMSSESIYSCPEDCSEDQPDATCTNLQNDVCDPDCAKGIDPDCSASKDSENNEQSIKTSTTTAMPKGGNDGTDYTIYIPLLLLTVLIVYAAIRMRKER